MEALYLLCSIISTLVKSTALSLLLALRSIPLLLFPSLSSASSSAAGVLIYDGLVRHERRRPAAHSFEYAVRYALVDLDRASLPSGSHLSADQARDVSGTNGPVLLLTIPESVGYEQNPLSVYYCYEKHAEGDREGKQLKFCIAEVTNTPWGERVRFGFRPGSDLVAKPLHVSPFMALKLWWKNVAFLDHPKYSKPKYREDALSRDQKLCCSRSRQAKDHQNLTGGEENKNRWCMWIDAQWPWS